MNRRRMSATFMSVGRVPPARGVTRTASNQRARSLSRSPGGPRLRPLPRALSGRGVRNWLQSRGDKRGAGCFNEREALCAKRFRPTMHDSKLDPPPVHVHLVNPLWDPAGGSDWRTIDTWRLLRDHAEVSLWSEFRPASVFHHQYRIRAIRPLVMRFPRGGTLVFVGTYFRIGH